MSIYLYVISARCQWSNSIQSYSLTNDKLTTKHIVGVVCGDDYQRCLHSAFDFHGSFNAYATNVFISSSSSSNSSFTVSHNHKHIYVHHMLCIKRRCYFWRNINRNVFDIATSERDRSKPPIDYCFSLYLCHSSLTGEKENVTKYEYFKRKIKEKVFLYVYLWIIFDNFSRYFQTYIDLWVNESMNGCGRAEM